MDNVPSEQTTGASLTPAEPPAPQGQPVSDARPTAHDSGVAGSGDPSSGSLRDTIRGVIEASAGQEQPVSPAEGDEQPPPFHHHPRWQQLTSRLGQLEMELAEARRQLQERQVAKQPEMPLPVEIVNALAADPKTGMAQLEAYIRQQKIAAGELLPDDLQEEVDAGNITEERAKELAKFRADADRYRQQLEQQALAMRRANLERTAQAVSEYERHVRATDPDYQHISGLVTELYRAKVISHVSAGGDPADQAWAIDALKASIDKARSLVSGISARRQPAQAVVPQPSSVPVGPPSSGSDKKRSLEDVIREKIMTFEG